MKLLRASDIAESTAIPLRSIQRLTRTGEIPCVRYGPKTIRYNRAQVLKALEKRGEKQKTMVPTY